MKLNVKGLTTKAKTIHMYAVHRPTIGRLLLRIVYLFVKFKAELDMATTFPAWVGAFEA